MECMFKLNIYPSFLPSLIDKSVKELDLLCFSRHGTPTDTQHADGQDRFCSRADLKYYILATESGRIIGETKVFTRTILFNGQKIVLGGIGSVARHPDFRKHGIATK